MSREYKSAVDAWYGEARQICAQNLGVDPIELSSDQILELYQEWQQACARLNPEVYDQAWFRNPQTYSALRLTMPEGQKHRATILSAFDRVVRATFDRGAQKFVVRDTLASAAAKEVPLQAAL